MSSLMDKVRAEEAARKAKAEVEAGPTPEVQAEMNKLLEEERAATRAKAGGAAITPPDEPAPKDIAVPLPPGVDAPGPCPVGGEIRSVSVEDAAARSFACVCGEAVKIKPQRMPDGTYQTKVPEHGGPKKEKAPKAPRISDVSKEVARKTGVGNVDVIREVMHEAAATPSEIAVYVDCRPDGVVMQRLETYAAEKLRALAEHCGLADVRAAGGDSPMGFGKWEGHLRALFREEPPAPGAYEVSATSKVGMMAVEELAAAGLTRPVRS